MFILSYRAITSDETGLLSIGMRDIFFFKKNDAFVSTAFRVWNSGVSQGYLSRLCWTQAKHRNYPITINGLLRLSPFTIKNNLLSLIVSFFVQ